MTLMSVIDASVAVDALVGVGAHGEHAREELRGRSTLEVPAIFGAEAASALRGLVGRGELSSIRAVAALDQLRRVRTVQYPFELFAKRAWELRNNLTIYDAWYVALAEWLGQDLVTADVAMANASGPRCLIRGPGGAT